MFQPLTPSAAFFLPGFLHQLGNLLLTVQGNAIQLDGATAPRARQAILAAAHRGAAGLQVMRFLLGEPTHGAAHPGQLLAMLVELGRVSARDFGLTIDLRGEHAATQHQVETGAFLPGTARLIEQMVALLPTGAAGRLVVPLRSEPGATVVGVEFAAAQGSLPFPLATGALADRLGDEGHAGCSFRPQPNGVLIAFPVALWSQAAEA